MAKLMITLLCPIIFSQTAQETRLIVLIKNVLREGMPEANAWHLEIIDVTK